MACTKELARQSHEGRDYQEAFTGFIRSCDQSFMSMGIPSVFSNISEVPPSGTVSLKVAGLSGVYGPYWHSTDDTLQAINREALTRDAEIFTKGLIQAVAEGPKVLDLMTEWNEFCNDIRKKLEAIKKTKSAHPVSNAFESETIWQELLDKLAVMDPIIKKRSEESDSEKRLQTIKHIVAMAYSAAAPGLQDPAGQAAESLFNEAFKKWASAKKDSFEYFSAWTAMVRGANHLFARLEKIELMFS